MAKKEWHFKGLKMLISASNIGKTFIDKEIIKDFSFSIREGEKIGLIGANGSGKTTLLNIIAGNLSPDSGELYKNKDLNIGYLEQQVEINSEKNLYDECLEVFEPLIELEKKLSLLHENIAIEGEKGDTPKLSLMLDELHNLTEEFEKNDGYAFPSVIKGTLKGLGFSDEELKKKVNLLSGGEKARVMLAKLLLRKPNFILMDEPTNHLDVSAIEWLEGYLSDLKTTMIIISHDRYFLDKIVNKVFLIDNQKLTSYEGNYTIFMEKHKKELEIKKNHYKNFQEEIKRQREIIQRFKKYGGERYNRLAKSREKLIEKMEQPDAPDRENNKVQIRFNPLIQSGHEVYRGTNLTKDFPDKNLFKDLNFIIYRGDKIGLIGPNGVGKTTLFNMILDNDHKYQGEILKGTQIRTAYYRQELVIKDPEKTVIDDLWDDYPKLKESEIRGRLAQFLFYGEDVFKEVGSLSGGEKARLSLLKLMLSGANTLFMDEPTNHLDIDSKEVLESAIQNYEGTVITISHDRYFLNSATNKIFELSKDGIREFQGNYDYYTEKKYLLDRAQEDLEPEITKTEKNKIQKQAIKEKKIAKALAKEIKNIENEISEKELRLNEIDELLSDPKTYEDSDLIKELMKERQDIEISIEALYEEWISKKE